MSHAEDVSVEGGKENNSHPLGRFACSVPAATHTLKQAVALGFEVMGLGIQDDNLERLLRPFGMPTRTIHNLPELAPAMFEMLQQALLRQP